MRTASGRMGLRRRAIAAAGVCLLATLIAPGAAWAHGLLISKKDLPIPEWLFAWGASLVLIVSFIGLSLAWRQTRFEDASWRGLASWLSRLVINPVTRVLCGTIGVVLLVVVIYAGFEGTAAPDRNFAVTFVFVTFWLGFVVLSVLFGDLFRAFNPWRAIALVVAGVFKLVARQSPPPPLRYPERLGRWPAAIGLVAFAWFELVYGTPGFQAVGLTPHSVAVGTLVYSAITFVGMALFGINAWLDRGETFSVYFNMFSRISPLELRDGRLGRRRWLSGLPGWGEVAGSTALVLFVIGITAFDGASEGLLQVPINDTLNWLVDRGVGPVAAMRLSNSLFLAVSIAAVCALFWAGIYGMTTVREHFSVAGWPAASPTASCRSRSPIWSPATPPWRSTASRLSSAFCSPTRSATDPTSSVPPPAGSTTAR
ncbi:MAG: fenitrothion hydrolase [Solirubrobacterales bacterium]